MDNLVHVSLVFLVVIAVKGPPILIHPAGGDAKEQRLAKLPQHVLASASRGIVRAQDAAVVHNDVDVADGADDRVAPSREMIVAEREAREVNDGVFGTTVTGRPVAGGINTFAGLATHEEEVV